MRAVLDELIGLFVDDGWLAAGLLAWCAVIAAVHAIVPAFAMGAAVLLLLGCAAVLAATVLRA